jgi:L-cystine transport system substrate-binding protein
MNHYKKIIGILAILILAVASFTGCGNTEKKSDAKPSDEGKKIVKVAHTQTYVPYDFVNKEGKSDGFEVAVLQEVAKLLPQYEFQFVPTSDDDLLIGVQSGKYDIGTKGAWYAESRKDKFIFPKNYIAASVIGIAFRKEDAGKITDMESFAKNGGKLVPIAPQNAQWAVVEDYNKTHPDNQVKLVASEDFQPADAYTWVLEGRYDGYFNIELAYKNNVEAEKGAYHKFADKLSYVRYKAIPTYPLFNKRDQKLADEYDAAIKKLQDSGKILELENKYFGEDIFKYIKK